MFQEPKRRGETMSRTAQRNCVLNVNHCGNGVSRLFSYTRVKSLSNCSAAVKHLGPLRHRRTRRRRTRRQGWLGFGNKPPCMPQKIPFRSCSATNSTPWTLPTCTYTQLPRPSTLLPTFGFPDTGLSLHSRLRRIKANGQATRAIGETG